MAHSISKNKYFIGSCGSLYKIHNVQLHHGHQTGQQNAVAHKGEIIGHHSATVPVFSDTLGEWRIHTGIDVSADEGAEVFAAATGEVSKIFTDPMHGLTVEVTHSGNIKTLYSNLADDGSVKVSVGDKVSGGDVIGTVGDTSISELAKEAHLHFELLVNEVSVNPMDYITKENEESDL